MIKWEVARGITLLELLISLLLLTLLVSITAPNYINMKERNLIKGSVEQFLALYRFAKQSAVVNNHDTYIHYYPHAQGSQYGWKFALLNEANLYDYASVDPHANKLVAGTDVKWEMTHQQMRISRLNGRPTQAGNIILNQADSSHRFKLIYHNVSGRIRVCSFERARYGYSKC